MKSAVTTWIIMSVAHGLGQNSAIGPRAYPSLLKCCHCLLDPETIFHSHREEHGQELIGKL